MSDASSATGVEPRSASGPLPAIITAWLVAGTLDIASALIYYGLTAHVAPTRLLQGIAAGLLGAASFQGGAATAVLGLACHYFIALVWTLLFFVAASRMTILTRRRVVTGVAYGIFVSVVMSFVVLPLSRVGPRPFHLRFFLIATFILIYAIGLPISLVIGRYHAMRARRTAPAS